MKEYEGRARDHRDRMRRAKSWHERAKDEKSLDEKFIFLWIAFDAAYGQESLPSGQKSIPSGQKPIPKTTLERLHFIEKLHKCDPKALYDIYDKCRDPIDKLINNKFVFPDFWAAMERSHGGVTWDEKWKRKFDKSIEKIDKSKKEKKVCALLNEVLDRIYTTRNQIFHGGMTYAEGFGRDQIKDSVEIMKVLVPAVLTIMSDKMDKDPTATAYWGSVKYLRFLEKPE